MTEIYKCQSLKFNTDINIEELKEMIQLSEVQTSAATDVSLGCGCSAAVKIRLLL